MPRASILLRLYGCQAVRRKLNLLQKTLKMHFSSKLSLHRTAWRPYRLSKIDALRIKWFYSPKDQFVKFWQKLLSFWWRLKNSVFLLHFYLNQSQINGVAWIGLNFYDYHDFQKNQGGYRIMKHTVFYFLCSSILKDWVFLFVPIFYFFLETGILWENDKLLFGHQSRSKVIFLMIVYSVCYVFLKTWIEIIFWKSLVDAWTATDH